MSAEAGPTPYRSFREQSLHYFIRDHQGIPSAPIPSPAAWRGESLRDAEAEWRLPFEARELDELETALAAIDARDLPLAAIAREMARECPRLLERFAAHREVLANGRGFVVLTGLPIAEWSEARAHRAFWLLGHLLGQPGAQNAEGELLGHVIDYGERDESPHARLYRTPHDIGFHCDAADVVGLLCLETAKTGGASRIASSVTIWNELLETEPELARLFFEPFALDRRDEHPPDQRPWLDIQPCCYGADGILRTFYHGEYFRSAQRLESIGPLPPERAKALDRYDEIGHDADVRLDMTLERGDVQLVSNHTIVHARTGYEEHPDRRRHLLRLWLSLD